MASSLEAQRKEKSTKLFFTQQIRDRDSVQGGSNVVGLAVDHCGASCFGEACGYGWAGGAGVRPLVRADCYLCRLFGPAYVTTAVRLANTEERSTERRNEGGLSPDIWVIKPIK
ncbi:hypothetical protein NDU88_005474 [Pleurodeles waltl]|uniref:Uncharacterized protein n=1 Tax=Pleurodeles waltl TaxID=8319 RepID=A0AAV7NRM0_PLEWA|nr:hypothetical protein NDU88_005474 [Pleurodeles waltl]